MAKSVTKSTRGEKSLIKLSASRPPGSLSEFKQIRADTDRAAVLKLMNGTKSAEQIANALGGKFTARYVMAHAYCLLRDCGIGYRTTEKGKLLAVYPGSLTYRDAVPAKKREASAVKTVETSAAT